MLVGEGLLDGCETNHAAVAASITAVDTNKVRTNLEMLTDEVRTNLDTNTYEF